MKILIDVNLSPGWVPILQAAGFDAVHWSTMGSVQAPDAEILAHASRHHFVILTRDLDFGSILAATRLARPSVVQLRVDKAHPDLIGSMVARVLLQSTAELDRGAILTIDLKRARLSILPLTPSDPGS